MKIFDFKYRHCILLFHIYSEQSLANLHYFFENSLAIFWKTKRELPFSLIRIIITTKHYEEDSQGDWEESSLLR